MAEAFLYRPIDATEVNHINGVKGDDKVNNLEWVSRSINTQHAYDNNLISNKGASHYKTNLTDKDVRDIRRLRKIGYKQKELADMFGIARTTVSSIVNNYKWKHLL